MYFHMSKQYMGGGGYGRKLSIDPSICPPVLGAKFSVLECLWHVQRQDERVVVVFFKEKKSRGRVGRCTWRVAEEVETEWKPKVAVLQHSLS